MHFFFFLVCENLFRMAKLGIFITTALTFNTVLNEVWQNLRVFKFLIHPEKKKG